MGIKDLKGQRFGRLVVLSLTGQDSHSNALWLCQCDCGGQIVTRNRILRTGDATSCGCKRKEKTTKHGMSNSPTYMTWRSVKDRCFNPKITGYENYGGRGITMCERWLDFKCFLSDMGVRPEGCTLDRIDNNKGYFPENCRWITPKQQSRNRRDNLIVVTNKGTMCLKDAAEVYGIRYTTLHERLRRGWSLDRALTTPPQKRSYPVDRSHE